MMIKFIDAALGVKRVIIKENQRAIALYKGKILGVLTPGEHRLPDRGRLEIDLHDLARPEFVSPYEKALLVTQPALAASHVTEVRAAAGEVVLVNRDGRLHAVLKPEDRAIYWTAAGPWTVERLVVGDDLMVPDAVRQRLLASGKMTGLVVGADVPEGHVALLFADGALRRQLEPGAHMLWAVTHRPVMKLVDLRRQSLDVTGQELLTRDRVTLRVNIAADYQVIDPVKATTAVKDYTDALHRALQFAFRKSLGAKSLDEILADKVTAEAEAIAEVRQSMATIGVTVGDIAVKNVILPGDMRDILNKVVAAEKEAEANIIRRREETNATRSLLNTARLMAENPVMLRLKELEALGDIASKVKSLTVHNGTQGLLHDLVSLQE